MKKIQELEKFIKENKTALLKSDPELFENLLHILKKATDDQYDQYDDVGDDEFSDGYSIVDDPNQDVGDDADQWLQENDPDYNQGDPQELDMGDSDSRSSGISREATPPAESDKSQEETVQDQAPAKKKDIYSKPWERGDYSDEDHASIDKLVGDGYSEREAARIVGAHNEHGDIFQAMHSGIQPSQISNKFLDELKPVAKQYLENADKYDKIHADVEKNPMKHAAGQMLSAHGDHTADYNKAYKDFLSSDDMKDKKGRERHKAIQSWKKEYKTNNPDYHEGLSNVSNVQNKYSEAKDTSQRNLQEKMQHIMTGGVSSPGSEQSLSAGIQHAGGGTSDEGDPMQVSVKQDKAATFARHNPKLIDKLSQDQHGRLKDIKSAKTAQRTILRKPKEGQQ